MEKCLKSGHQFGLRGKASKPLLPERLIGPQAEPRLFVEFQARVGKDGGVVRAFLDHDTLPVDDQRFTTVDPPGPINVLLVDREEIHGVSQTRSAWCCRMDRASAGSGA